MQEAIMIGPFVVKMSLLMLIGSLVMGFLFFWITSPWKKDETRYYLDQIANALFFFVIALFIGKVFLNLSLFFEDPLAVLAFPSDSTVFYFAFVCFILFAGYYRNKIKFPITGLALSFSVVIITALFSFLFGQHIFTNVSRSMIELTLHFVLLLGWILLQAKLTSRVLLGVMVTFWGMIKFLLSMVKTTYVFTFPLASWFYLLILAIGILALINWKGKVKMWNRQRM
ncbi:hypothetical protein BN1058_02253 [Paraliobacillus sp. PM-2]|uniref:hypothetical protein n=1 Tax=Paraliobacillus sp. PM-2 TaxID=1462524 RepID=UPI00061BA1FB|nr:hypothetical protein [Paraliobacillus sp. PM-2]CQR47919.1 hypothetical protein BN1058_02253 [Paraliobacillus sp. PM-2]